MSENECFINRLPIEILEIIFNSISLTEVDRKNLRLVCKSWHILCNRRINELRIVWDRLNNDPNAYQRIADFKFERFNLKFSNQNEVMRLPSTIWEKMGVNIVSLEFCYCPAIGDKLMKTIIQVCENLRFFRVQMSLTTVEDIHVKFCTPELLGNLNIIRSSLKTFKIGLSSTPEDNQFVAWQLIFEVLFRIYPNVIHYKTSCPSKSLKFTLSEQYHEEDVSKMPSILTLLLSKSSHDWYKAVEKLSTVRLTSVSFLAVRIGTPIFDFFSKQKELKSIEINFRPEGKQAEINDLVLHILDNCSTKLRHFKYILYEEFPYSIWLQSLTTRELSKLCASMLKVKDELEIDAFTFLPKRSLISICEPHKWDYFIIKRDFYPFYNDLSNGLKLLMPHFIFLQQLNMETCISDEALQTIFKYLTNLRILKLHLNFTNTNFGLIGRCDGGTKHSGYSINRLQNLEKLTLCEVTEAYHFGKIWSIDDAAFSTFHLPKLHYLYSFSPGLDCFDFRIFGTNLPELRTINLSMCPGESLLMSEESVLSLCEYSKNLHTIDMRRMEINILIESARLIFASCPTLRYFYTSKHCYYYDSLTKILKFKDIK